MERDLHVGGAARAGRDTGDRTWARDGVSFGGSSVAENAVYINGLNVTDFYNRVGFSSVPYAFYKEFQVKTGGYSVEFGRTTGGVINAVTRSGTNEFEFGAEVAWEPSSLQSRAGTVTIPTATRSSSAVTTSTTAPARRCMPRARSSRTSLFFFALYEIARLQPGQHRQRRHPLRRRARRTTTSGAPRSTGRSTTSTWSKLLAFSDEQPDRHRQLRVRPRRRRARRLREHGASRTTAAKTGRSPTPPTSPTRFSMKALYGENEREFSRLSAERHRLQPHPRHARRPSTRRGLHLSPNVVKRDDNREAARLDFEWALGDHQLRFGLDREMQHLEPRPVLSRRGPAALRSRGTPPGATLANGGAVPAGVTAYVRSAAERGGRQVRDAEHGLLPRGQLVRSPTTGAQRRRARRGLRQQELRRRQLHQDRRHDRAAVRLLLGHEGRRPHQAVRQRRPLLPAGRQRHQHQAGGRLPRRAQLVRASTASSRSSTTASRTSDRSSARRSARSTTRRATARSATCAAKSTPTWIRSTRTSSSSASRRMINDQWSWGVRGIYRKLTNAIDDMEITSTGILCDGEPGYDRLRDGEPRPAADGLLRHRLRRRKRRLRRPWTPR